MSIVRLSRALLLISCIGLLLLTGLVAHGVVELRRQHAETEQLLALRSRVEHFGVGTMTMLMFDVASTVRSAYRREAEQLIREFETLGQQHPDALKAGYRLKRVLELMARIPGESHFSVDLPHTHTRGALGLHEPEWIAVNELFGELFSLNIALDDAVASLQQAIAASTRSTAYGFAAATLLFAMSTMLGLGYLDRRVRRPVGALMRTIEDLRNGKLYARAPLQGRDELSQLGTALNQLADEQQASTRQLTTERQNLLRYGHMLDESQKLADTGSWQHDLGTGGLQWSKELFRLCGLDPDTDKPTLETLPQLIIGGKGSDRAQALKSARQGRSPEACDFSIQRADGEQRVLREHIAVSLDHAGQPALLTGSVQDLTSYWHTQSRLEQYRAVLTESDAMLSIVDPAGRVLLVNPAYAAFSGATPEALEGRPLADVVEEHLYRNEIAEHLKRCRERLTAHSVEYTRNNARGESRRLLARYTPIRDPFTDNVLVAAIITDVTDLRAKEAELREKTRLINIAGRVARLGGWSVDVADRKVTWSRVTAEIHGMPPDYEPTFEEAIDFYAPEYRERIAAAFRACAEHGEPYDLTTQIINAQGEHRWVRSLGHPMRDDRGRVIGVAGAFQDISSAKAAEHEIQRLAERLGKTLESITDGFFTLDRDWRFHYVNAAAEKLLERPLGELQGSPIWEIFPDAVDGPIYHAYQRAMREHTTVSLETFYEPLSRWFDIRAYPSVDGLTVFFSDVTERRQLLQQLEAQEAFLRSSRQKLSAALFTRQALINALPANIALLDGSGTIIDVNQEWRAFGEDNQSTDQSFGMGSNYLTICNEAQGPDGEEAQAVADGICGVLRGQRSTFALEYPCHAPGRQQWFRLTANRLTDLDEASGKGNSEATAVVMHVDITERKLAEAALSKLAFQDPLTDLSSRSGLVNAIQTLCDEDGWQHNAVLLMFDLNNMHDINNTYGYEGGDELLRELAARLRAALPEGAVAARVGGDEFAVFIPDEAGVSAADTLTAIHSVLKNPFDIDGVKVEVSAQYGFTVFGQTPRESEDLLREAELALYHAREKSFTAKDSVRFSESLDQATRERIRLTRALREAIPNGELQLHFQPKVRLSTGELLAAEALLRWDHPVMGLVRPDVFIPVAEQSQLIVPIGEWVVNQACRFLREWQDHGLNIVRVAVNVSMVQMMASDFVAVVERALKRHGVPPSQLCLEITESVFSQHSEALQRRLKRLHDLGVTLSLDDFGTGYSSLLYLQQYRFDEIKIDQGFTQRLLDDSYSRRIIGSVLSVAEVLKADVVAEGVESPAMADALMELGCDTGQGFYYSMPLDVEDFRWLLEKRSTLPIMSRHQVKQGARA